MARIDREEYGVDEMEETLALHSVANSNVLLTLITLLADRKLLTRKDLQLLSNAFSKPLDLDGPRENEALRQLQDRFEAELALLASELT